MSLKTEILEQPEVLARLLENQREPVEAIAASLRKYEIRYLFLAARGTSDNAGLYAKYLWGAYNRLPTVLATPSLFSLYGKPPSLKNALVVGISQSGRSPDIVEVIREARRQGAPTLVITNAPDSPLAQTAEFVIDVQAGPEQAIAATKTYTAQLMAIAMLSIALNRVAGEDDERWPDLQDVPTLVRQALDLEPVIERAAERYRYMEQCVVLGRGFNYATAFEWSLKMKELAYIIAAPYSSADFQHGPVAVVSQGFPVLAVAPDGVVFDDMHALLKSLVIRQGVELLAISNREEALSLAHTPLRLPIRMPEWVSPIVAITPAQLFSYYLTRAKGYDTEAPRGLQKVTLTH
ncbi:MAG TPA: SIS domain-containing protein [Anaerolineae bacterium]|nr:SIS domain-containing protein [Anaerolineae bacterium]HQK15338.1 SIS domain-containing protein [Anaerolineae bacterium]